MCWVLFWACLISSSRQLIQKMIFIHPRNIRYVSLTHGIIYVKHAQPLTIKYILFIPTGSTQSPETFKKNKYSLVYSVKAKKGKIVSKMGKDNDPKRVKIIWHIECTVKNATGIKFRLASDPVSWANQVGSFIFREHLITSEQSAIFWKQLTI